MKVNCRTSFHLQFSVFLLLLFTNVTSEKELADDYLDSSFRIEPTPVFVLGRSSSYYRIGWPSEQPGASNTLHDGGDREKRDYNLEDFLIWMPSGDGPTDQWNQQPKNTEWIKPYTKTVYVTKTKYETLVLSTNVNANPTVKDIFPTKTTTNPYGKDIYGSFGKDIDTGCKIHPFYDTSFHYGSTFPTQNDKRTTTKQTDESSNNDFSYKYSETKYLPTTSYKSTELRTSTRVTYPDIADFLHSSLGYEGPSSILNDRPSTTYATPALPTRVKENGSIKTVNLVLTFSTNDFPMQTTHLELPTKVMPTPSISSQFIVSTKFYPSTSEFINRTTPKIYETSFISTKQSQESTGRGTTPIYTATENVTTSEVEFTSTFSPTVRQTKNIDASTNDTTFTTLVTSFPFINSTMDVESTVDYQPAQFTNSTFYESLVTDSTLSVTTLNISFISTNKTICNCSADVETTSELHELTAQKESEVGKSSSITLPSVPDTTLSIPSVFPSPSNNATFPIDKKHWIRTIINGPPTKSNKLAFENEITNKLTKAYTYAYKFSILKNTSGLNSAALEKKFGPWTIIATSTYDSVVRNRNRRDLYFSSNKNKLFPKKNFPRNKRQISADISVRMQNITYMPEPNITELVYSVFMGDSPILAKEAVDRIRLVNTSLVENVLNRTLAVKAEEFLQLHKLSEDENHKFLITIFGVVAGVVVFLFLVVFFVWQVHKHNKKKQTRSTDNLEDISEGYTPRSEMGTLSGRENLGFAETHDEESTPEVSDQRRSSQAALDIHSYGSRPSTSQEQPVPYPRTKSAEELGYSVVDRKSKQFVDQDLSTEHEYSIPKPSQRQTNIQIALDYDRDKKRGDYIPGTSLPKFLPPPRQVLEASPLGEQGPQLPPRNVLLDEAYWSKPGASHDKPTIFEVQERQSPDRSMSGISKGSSELETSPNSPSLESGAGIGRLRRRFHDLLDDAFSLMHGQKPGDKVTPLATPHHTRNSRARSAMPLRRPRLLDDLEGLSRTLTPERPHVSLRPWSAAAVMHSPRDMMSILPSGGSTEESPRSAWGDPRRSITPVNLPNQRSYDRPDSAPAARTPSDGLRSPTPIDPETGLRMYDPAVPLIRAIKEELNRFKASVNTDSSNA